MKFKAFTNAELKELWRALQQCSRDNKTSRALWDQLEKEVENRQSK